MAYTAQQVQDMQASLDKLLAKQPELRRLSDRKMTALVRKIESEMTIIECPANSAPCPEPVQCEMRGCLRLDPPLFEVDDPLEREDAERRAEDWPPVRGQDY